MGRYYRGDIEGKFWFAIQASNDADFFGCEGEPPNYLELGSKILECVNEKGSCNFEAELT